MKDICPLCKRELGTNWNKHHIKPKVFGGKETVKIHFICHNKIHSIFTERELHQMKSFDQLFLNINIQRFVKWVSKKDIEFYSKTKQIKTKKR